MNHEKGYFVGWHLIGYSTKVSDYLGSNYKVFQPDDNGCFAKYTLRMLFDYRDGIAGSDFSHWNNGFEMLMNGCPMPIKP